MNYDKLSRSLRYYYEKGIMQKVSLQSRWRFYAFSDASLVREQKPYRYRVHSSQPGILSFLSP